jgi:uncharacterized protein YukE
MSLEMSTLSSGWKGPAAGIVIGKSNEIMEEVQKSVARIESIAQTIRSTAEAIRNAEEQQLAAEESALSEANAAGKRRRRFLWRRERWR